MSETPRIVQPNEWDIEFAVRKVPKGMLVTCTLCNRTVEVGTDLERLKWIGEHRSRHWREGVPPEGMNY